MGAHRTNPTAQAVARGEAVCTNCGTPLGAPRGERKQCAKCPHEPAQLRTRPPILAIASMLNL